MYAALLCDEASLDIIFEKYLSTDAPDEKFTLLYSMKDFKNEAMFRRTLEFALTVNLCYFLIFFNFKFLNSLK
jgi:hypothetical protein